MMSTIADAETARADAENMDALATSIANKSKGRLPGARGLETGISGQIIDTVTGAAGWEGPNSKDNMDLANIRAREIKANKADATMTEGDRKLLEKGMPMPETPDDIKIAWLLRMRDKAATTARVEVAKGEFLQENKSFDRAKKPIVIGGIQLPAGTTIQTVVDLAQAKPAASRPSFADRAQQLKAQGVSAADAKATMKSEGY